MILKFLTLRRPQKQHKGSKIRLVKAHQKTVPHGGVILRYLLRGFEQVVSKILREPMILRQKKMIFDPEY